MPGFVATNMTRLRRGYLFAPLPNHYAESAVATIGVDAVTTGYWPHWLMLLMMRVYMWVTYKGFLEFSRKRMHKRSLMAKEALSKKKAQ